MKNTRTPYGCTICKKEFSNPIYLVKHVELRHPPEKNTQSLLDMFIKDLVSAFGKYPDSQLCKRCKNVNIEATKRLLDPEDQSYLESDNIGYISIYPLQNFNFALKPTSIDVE